MFKSKHKTYLNSKDSSFVNDYNNESNSLQELKFSKHFQKAKSSNKFKTCVYCEDDNCHVHAKRPVSSCSNESTSYIKELNRKCKRSKSRTPYWPTNYQSMTKCKKNCENQKKGATDREQMDCSVNQSKP